MKIDWEPWVIGIIGGVCFLIGCYVGAADAKRYGFCEPDPIQAKFYIEAFYDNQYEFPKTGGDISYMYWDGRNDGGRWWGTPEYYEKVRNGGFPPRCRNVREGMGCIDWFEAGEKNWDAVLKGRPK